MSKKVEKYLKPKGTSSNVMFQKPQDIKQWYKKIKQ